MSNDEKIILMMPKIQTHEETVEEAYGPSTGTVLEEQVPISPSAISEFANQYTGYELDTIEVHVKGAAQTNGITRLFVGLSGEAGVKLQLKKKKS
ncbi:hypothetical protein [Lysinibacillus sphaericus]|uniref:Uncharacterized protein n=1 Tax=Lysinibacillus sphaericus OT4b.31 TaxID=1285586 RepID=R7ZAC4_LYSSH|nr:hypothetical protein [Lysinibacillus sphaericus]EON70936.1 hypothetical protein H131_18197 [Lysinibacillus sphaericus OT4b.31]